MSDTPYGDVSRKELEEAVMARDELLFDKMVTIKNLERDLATAQAKVKEFERTHKEDVSAMLALIRKIKELEEQVKVAQLQLSRLPDIISELEKDDKYCHSPIVFDLDDIYHKARIQEAR